MAKGEALVYAKGNDVGMNAWSLSREQNGHNHSEREGQREERSDGEKKDEEQKEEEGEEEEEEEEGKRGHDPMSCR